MLDSSIRSSHQARRSSRNPGHSVSFHPVVSFTVTVTCDCFLWMSGPPHLLATLLSISASHPDTSCRLLSAFLAVSPSTRQQVQCYVIRSERYFSIHEFTLCALPAFRNLKKIVVPSCCDFYFEVTVRWNVEFLYGDLETVSCANFIRYARLRLLETLLISEETEDLNPGPRIVHSVVYVHQARRDRFSRGTAGETAVRRGSPHSSPFTRAFVKAAPGRDASLRRLVFVVWSSRLVVVVYFNEPTMGERGRASLSGRESLLRGQSRLFVPPSSLLRPFRVCERCTLAGGTNRQAASTKVDGTGVTSLGIGSFPQTTRDISLSLSEEHFVSIS